MIRPGRPVLALAAGLLLFADASGQQKKPKPAASLPRIIVAQPLGVVPGKPTKVTLRGVNFDGITAVQCHAPHGRARLLGPPTKALKPSPQQMPLEIGDRQMEIEIMLPADFANPTVAVSLVGPAGAGPPHRLLVDDDTPHVAEKEPNNGFRTAQAVPVPVVIEGRIAHAQDVDVFRFSGKAGQRVRVEVQAARFGSPLDGHLLICDAHGRTLASCAAAPGSPDPALTLALPTDGAYLVCLSDAQDLGSEAHVYRLLIRVVK